MPKCTQEAQFSVRAEHYCEREMHAVSARFALRPAGVNSAEDVSASLWRFVSDAESAQHFELGAGAAESPSPRGVLAIELGPGKPPHVSPDVAPH